MDEPFGTHYLGFTGARKPRRRKKMTNDLLDALSYFSNGNALLMRAVFPGSR